MAEKKEEKRPCKYADCGKRRRHFEDPYTERGTQYIDPPYIYCSLECALLDGAISMSKSPGSTAILP
jgi:hypothetical protein